MTDIILGIILFILFIIGYILVLMTPFFIHKNNNKVFRCCKRWFILTQGAALLIALFLIDTERNLIPMIGYIVLIMASLLSGTALLIGFVVPPDERSQRAKKSLKKCSWIFYSAMFLAILWAIVWWKKLYG